MLLHRIFILETSSLLASQIGDRVALMRKSSGELHYYVNEVDQGVAALLTPQPIWGVVDIYGRAVQVTIVEVPPSEIPAAPPVRTELAESASVMETELRQLSQILQVGASWVCDWNTAGLCDPWGFYQSYCLRRNKR